MNREFHDIIERIKGIDMHLVSVKVSIPALLNLNARLERLEQQLIPKTIKEEQL